MRKSEISLCLREGRGGGGGGGEDSALAQCNSALHNISPELLHVSIAGQIT